MFLSPGVTDIPCEYSISFSFPLEMMMWKWSESERAVPRLNRREQHKNNVIDSQQSAWAGDNI